MNNSKETFIRLVKHPVKFRLFLLAKLPSAFFSGVRVAHFDPTTAIVSVPFRWFTQNPFRSTYFACLAMAAEMSTGLLAMMHTHQSVPPISMLVVGLQATYFKKATGVTRFTCQDGDAIRATVETALSTGEGRVIEARSIGRNTNGEIVAEFLISWSFKPKA